MIKYGNMKPPKHFENVPNLACNICLNSDAFKVIDMQ